MTGPGTTPRPEPSSLLASLCERYLDPENDDPAEWTDEMMLDRINDLIGEGWSAAGQEMQRTADAAQANADAMATVIDRWNRGNASLREQRDRYFAALEQIYGSRSIPPGMTPRDVAALALSREASGV